MDAKATGINRHDGDTFDLAATPNATGRKKAAAAVLLMKALRTATTSIIAASRVLVRVPAWRMMALPTKHH
jgi:hypothetical protein